MQILLHSDSSSSPRLKRLAKSMMVNNPQFNRLSFCLLLLFLLFSFVNTCPFITSFSRRRSPCGNNFDNLWWLYFLFANVWFYCCVFSSFLCHKSSNCDALPVSSVRSGLQKGQTHWYGAYQPSGVVWRCHDWVFQQTKNDGKGTALLHVWGIFIVVLDY